MTVDIGLNGVNDAALLRGSVISHHEYYAPAATKFEIKIVVLDITTPIIRGQNLVLHSHTVAEAAYISDLVAIVDKNGKIENNKPRALLSNCHAVVKVAVNRRICLERYNDINALGRVALRDKGATIAIGIVVD